MDSDMGCMTSARQKETVERQLAACVASGARGIARSTLPKELEGGNFMNAVVLEGAAPDSPVMREEIFGPVACVAPYKDDEEAIRIANDSSLGLTASVWSRDHRRAKEMAARINAGAVLINDHLMSHGLAETPWGGFGDSGLGRTHAELGFLEMLQPKVIVDDILPGAKKDIWWPPYSEKVYRGLKAIIDFAGGRTLAKRLGGALRLLPFFFRYWEK